MAREPGGAPATAGKSRRMPLSRRFNVALTDEAYGRLRKLNGQYGLSNNYLLTILLERLDDYADAGRLAAAFDAFVAVYGAPAPKPTDRQVHEERPSRRVT